MTKHLKGHITRRACRDRADYTARRFSATLSVGVLSASRSLGCYESLIWFLSRKESNVTKQVQRGEKVGTSLHVFGPNRSLKNKQEADWRHPELHWGFLKMFLLGLRCQTSEEELWDLTWSKFNQINVCEKKPTRNIFLFTIIFLQRNSCAI